MYAVIVTGGKQYRVEVGTELEVELLDVEPGQAITLDRVLLVADGDESAIGRPLVADAAVSAEVVRQTRGEKLIAFKYRPKARSRVKKGHRQELTVLRITDVRLGSKSAAESVRKAEADGSVKTGRDSVGQRLGVKAGDGQLVPAGSIIVRQRGQTFLSGTGTGIGKDYTVFATITGRVKFEHAT